jgi:hypothetical protein
MLMQEVNKRGEIIPTGPLATKPQQKVRSED